MNRLRRGAALGLTLGLASVGLGAQPALAGCSIDVTDITVTFNWPFP